MKGLREIKMIITAGIISIIGLFSLIITFILTTLKKPDGSLKFSSSFKQLGILIFTFCQVIAMAILFALPNYLVWQQQKAGEAELAKAEQNRQIAIQEAKAKEESAKYLANTDIVRAEGISKANKIIGDSLKNNDAYIHYLWIEALKESKNEVIYIPTEAGIPITESMRFKRNQ